jgi:hypothetical protein
MLNAPGVAGVTVGVKGSVLVITGLVTTGVGVRSGAGVLDPAPAPGVTGAVIRGKGSLAGVILGVAVGRPDFDLPGVALAAATVAATVGVAVAGLGITVSARVGVGLLPASVGVRAGVGSVSVTVGVGEATGWVTVGAGETSTSVGTGVDVGFNWVVAGTGEPVISAVGATVRTEVGVAEAAVGLALIGVDITGVAERPGVAVGPGLLV